MHKDRSIEQKTNLSEIEKEINDKFKNTMYLKKEDFQVYLELNSDNLYPIEFKIKPNGDISIKDDINYILKDIYIGSNKQFFYESYTISETTTNILRLSNTFKTAWDSSKYMIFRNGYLLNSNVYKMGIPSFKNILKTKTIYSMVSFKKGDRIDVFYIENKDILEDVPFNRDLYITTRRVFAVQDDQVDIKIPYPYDSYPRGDKMFICLTKSGMYLDNRYDYNTSFDKEYLTLRYENRLISSYVDYLIFLFPYVRADFESDSYNEIKDKTGNFTGIDFEYSYSILNPSNEEEGIVNFYPIFDQYTLQKKNFILFGNTTLIDKDRYNLIDNGTIQFINETDIKHCSSAKYTMVIFKEQDITDQKKLLFGLEFYSVVAEEDRQQRFYIPKIDNQKKSFLAFLGSTSLDVHNKFTWKYELDQMILTNKEDYVKKGRVVNFIFYTPNNEDTLSREKEIALKKMMWDISEDGKSYIPEYLYTDMQFNDSNLLLFLNGTFIQPDRYQIDKNNCITFVNEDDDGLKNTKTLTGIYLVSYIPNYEKDDNTEGPYNFIDMKEDHDWIWFDEIYAVPYEIEVFNVEKDLPGNLVIQQKSIYKDISSSIKVSSPYSIMALNGSITLNKGTINKLINGSVTLSNTYSIQVTQPDHGRIEVNGKVGTLFKFPENTSVTIQAFADKGYIVEKLYLNKVTNAIEVTTVKEGE